MAGLESMSALELREALVNNYGFDEREVNNIASRNTLAVMLQKAILENDDDEEDNQGFFNEIEEEEREDILTSITEEEEKQALIPKIGSPNWQQYVLDHLLPGEYFEKNGNKYPKCAGLRRITNVLLGEIVESLPTMVIAPSDVLGRATVVYQVKILVHNEVGKILVFAEAADAHVANTPEPFSLHLVATASSRAEGRAFKKALMLNVHTAEEMLNKDDKKEVVEQLVETTGEFNEDGPISGTQIKSIERLSKRLKIDTGKFITLNYPTSTIETLTASEASELCNLLNRYQNKGKEKLDIPEEIKLATE